MLQYQISTSLSEQCFIRDKIGWCLSKDEGISIVEPNPNLSKAYILKAEESLKVMRHIEAKDWKIVASYYTMYFSVYAILMRIGIKCEIHSCTLEFVKQYLHDYFTREDLQLLKNAMKAREDAQYYVDREVTDDFYKKMLKKVSEILIQCKEIIDHLTERRINEIRASIQTRYSLL